MRLHGVGGEAAALATVVPSAEAYDLDRFWVAVPATEFEVASESGAVLVEQRLRLWWLLLRGLRWLLESSSATDEMAVVVDVGDAGDAVVFSAVVVGVLVLRCYLVLLLPWARF